MTSKIELKRKELIQNYNSLMEYCKHNQEAFDRLRGLMAQFQQLEEMGKAEEKKEFLDFLDTLYANWMIHSQLDWMILDKIKELKQSIEGEKP